MNDFMMYLIRVNGIFIIFYLVYRVIFSRLTFYRLNRLLLLFIGLISCILPVIKVFPAGAGFSGIFLSDFSDPLVTMGLQPELVVNDDPSYSFFRIIMSVYFLGFLFFIFRLILSALRLIRLKQEAFKKYDEGYYLFYAGVPVVFSFFRWIFLPEAEGKSVDKLQIIHEKEHGRLWHSMDLLFTEFLKAFLWFNPFVYFFQKSLRTVHEFEVDSVMIKDTADKIRYLNLLKENLDYREYYGGIASYFLGLTIQKRIFMIIKNSSSKINLFRYIILVPLLGFLFMAFSVAKGDPPSLFPVVSGVEYRITVGYGKVFTNPFTKKRVTHSGIDIAAPMGTEILATSGGTVVKVSEEKGYGKLIVIDHGDGIESLYAHLKDYNVEEGQGIRKGSVIAFMGSTGMSTGSHLHFEIRKNGKAVDPGDYILK